MLWKDLLPVEGTEQERVVNRNNLELQPAEVTIQAIEAQGWQKNEQGELILFGTDSQQIAANSSATCGH